MRLVRLVLEENNGISYVSQKANIDYMTLKGGIRNYQVIGIDAFYHQGWTKRTSVEKEAAVKDYLSVCSSLQDICRKYKISDTHTLRRWISVYNDHKKLKASGTGGSSLMTKGRKTTFEESIEIVQYCIAHDHNYAEASEKYQVSYQQARSYTIKYEAGGIDALQDNRRKRKLLMNCLN